MKSTLNVVITGATGNIAKAIIPLLTNGLVFGPRTKINLRLNDIPSQKDRLRGTFYEIEDGAYPLVSDISYSDDLRVSLNKADVCIFIASYPHRVGMERKHLLEKNSQIYRDIGSIMDSVADKNCKTVVVANPVNSLTTILANSAPSIHPKNFTGLSRLDYNRARTLLAKKYQTRVEKVTNIIVWGNHSDTQYPDASHARVNGIKIREQPGAMEFLKGEYIQEIRHRWLNVFEALGTTSIMSPAQAVRDHLTDWYFGSEHNDYISMAIISDGTYYDVPKGMAFSLPVVSKDFEYYVEKRFHIKDHPDSWKLIQESIKEIETELNSINFKL